MKLITGKDYLGVFFFVASIQLTGFLHIITEEVIKMLNVEELLASVPCLFI